MFQTTKARARAPRRAPTSSLSSKSRWIGRWWIWQSSGGSHARACPTPLVFGPSSGSFSWDMCQLIVLYGRMNWRKRGPNTVISKMNFWLILFINLFILRKPFVPLSNSVVIHLCSGQSEVTRRMEEMTASEREEHNAEGTGVLPRAEIVRDEHPLSLGKTSVWNQYFQESEIVEQIDRDVKRTHPEMEFFNGDSSDSLSNQESLKRILTIFAKLNPGIRYVQGMNEVLAPLYYVFKNDPDQSQAALAEPDAFFCFVELLSGFRDNFCKQLDNSVVGIRSTITTLSQLLRRHDEELWRHLEVVTKVNPQFYAFRWITLLLTQEFQFRDCLSLWDTLLGDPEGPQATLLRVCCAMLILVRRRLLAGDFTANLKLLQNYPPTNIDHILHIANKLRGPLPF
ncbi:uncharacterized protein [Zea mays]|uniref:Rab-GAP TBC domain-containing protein n=1 Tax=Zea mays TaxID=4577 RepID=A0A804RHD0_MAIZE|nr:uncharacterized protein LOC100272273 isoform X1 [Zea mays]|eukprot:XP_020400509.1 uncharacterized protein LOC100272273 isoform X1 [Zea mays]